jgi:hypothetical protein
MKEDDLKPKFKHPKSEKFFDAVKTGEFIQSIRLVS